MEPKIYNNFFPTCTETGVLCWEGQCPGAPLPAEAVCAPHSSDCPRRWASCPGSDPAPDTRLWEEDWWNDLIRTYIIMVIPGGELWPRACCARDFNDDKDSGSDCKQHIYEFLWSHDFYVLLPFVVANVPEGCFAVLALGRGLRWSEAGQGSCDWSMFTILLCDWLSHVTYPEAGWG